MKNHTSLILILMLFVSSCGTYKTFTGTISFDASKMNESIKSNELNGMISSSAPMKFVLREPDGFGEFAPEDKMQINDLFSQIEKELIQQGQIVKDRRLLNLLIEKSDLDIATKAIDTDIIIEIIDLEFDIPNQIKDFNIKEKGIQSNFNNWSNIEYIDCQLSTMECRITMVKEGNVGGIFKFYVSGCDDNKSFYVKIFEDYEGTLDPSKEAYVGWNYSNVGFKSLTHTYDMNELSRNKAIQKLVSELLKQLKRTDIKSAQ